MNPTSFRIPFTGTLSDSTDTEELLYDIWAAILKEVKSLHFLTATQQKWDLKRPESLQEIFKNYLCYPALDSFTIDDAEGFIEIVFPSPDGRSRVLAPLCCHWFRHALAKKPGPVRKLLKAEGLAMVKPETPEQIKATETARFVNLNKAYYMILPGEEKIAACDDRFELTWDGLEEYQKKEVDRLLEQDHCGCHLCIMAREKQRVPKARTPEQAVEAFMAWAEENLEGTPQNVAVYYKKEMVFLGQLENCFILTYTLGSSETLVAFSGPLVHGLKGISLATYKQSNTKEHKMLMCNYAAAYTVLEHLRENRPELLEFDREEEQKVLEIMGNDPPADDLVFLKADYRLKMAEDEMWFLTGAMRRNASYSSGVRGDEGTGVPLKRKALVFADFPEEEQWGYRLFINLQEDYAHHISAVENPKTRYPLDYPLQAEYTIGRFAGPYEDFWDSVLRCLDDSVWQWWRYVTEQSE